MTELIDAIRTTRKVGSGQSEEDIVHGHVQFVTPDGQLLAETCVLARECEYLRYGKPDAPSKVEGR